ncbi:MAG: TraR/DksA family transcriptional regulator [Alphaproteobacteria bacterium]|nr:MAG: TraR/DksA family transcriptional regulator [Alphaproteobacteria bacterium]
MVDVAKYRTILEARRDELEARLREIEETLEGHQTRDWEELATEREGDEVLESMGEAARSELAKITAALTRVEEGEFGYCVRCGAEIAPERLDLIPFTPFCRTCAEDVA